MTRFGTILSLLTLGLLLIAKASASDTEFNYKDEVQVSIEAVCSIAPDEIKCWDAQGNLVDEWARRIEGELTSGNYHDVGFTYGKMTRYVILKTLTQSGATASIGQAGSPYTKGRSLYLRFRSEPSATARTEYTVVRVETEPDASTIDVPFMLRRTIVPKPVLPFNPGATVKVEDWSFKFISVEPVPEEELAPAVTRPSQFARTINMFGNMQYGNLRQGMPAWRILLEKTSGKMNKSLSCRFLDNAGILIEAINSEGKPVPKRAYDFELQQRNERFQAGLDVPAAKYFLLNRSAPLSTQQNEDKFYVYTNVDPQWAKSLVIEGSVREVKMLTGLPAYPKE